MEEKNLIPVLPPGTFETTKMRRAATCTTAATVVSAVDWRLRALYSVPNSDKKYTVVNMSRSDENRCFKWFTGPHKKEKLKHK